jgi:hypothetical protein
MPSKSTAEGLKRGIAYFQRAIEKDPSDALAYAGLPDAYVGLGGGFGYTLANDVFPKAEAAAIKALEIDDTAHAAFGSVKALYKWDWTGSERECRNDDEPIRTGADASETCSALKGGRGDPAGRGNNFGSYLFPRQENRICKCLI